MIEQLRCVKHLTTAVENGTEPKEELLAKGAQLKVESILAQRNDFATVALIFKHRFNVATEINTLQTALQAYQNMENQRDAPDTPMLPEEVVKEAASRLE